MDYLLNCYSYPAIPQPERHQLEICLRNSGMGVAPLSFLFRLTAWWQVTVLYLEWKLAGIHKGFSKGGTPQEARGGHSEIGSSLGT